MATLETALENLQKLQRTIRIEILGRKIDEIDLANLEKRALVRLMGWRILFKGSAAELLLMAAEINSEEFSLRKRQDFVSINDFRRGPE